MFFLRLMLAGMAAGLFYVGAATAVHRTAERSGMVGASLVELARVHGMEEACCQKNAGGSCGTNGGGEGCHAPLPHKCYCTSPGKDCWVYTERPKTNDVCDTTQPGSCTIVTQTPCWIAQGGVCDNDAGGFSWYYLCSQCGCDGSGAQTSGGTYKFCGAGYTECISDPL